MKKLIAATAALTLVGGGTGSFAEITISGDAKFGIDYNSDPTDENGDSDDNKSKHTFTHEMGVDFTGSGTTDGGLTFGGKAGFDTGKSPNEGSVFVSGAFGTITFGEQDAADHLAGGIADVGLNGAGVDNVVEDIRGTTAHQFRYDQSIGGISLAISAGTEDGKEAKANIWTPVSGGGGDVITSGQFAAKKNSYAIGMSFSASGATVGLGYDSKETISAGLGYSTGQISANAFYAKRERPYKHLGRQHQPGGSGGGSEDGTIEAGMTGLGVDVSYTMGASTLTLVYAKTDVSNIQPYWDSDSAYSSTNSGSLKGMGVGISHDLGGGAKLVAGFAQVPEKAVGELDIAEIGQVFDGDDADSTMTFSDREEIIDSLSSNRNLASVGLSFSF